MKRYQRKKKESHFLLFKVLLQQVVTPTRVTVLPSDSNTLNEIR